MVGGRCDVADITKKYGKGKDEAIERMEDERRRETREYPQEHPSNVLPHHTSVNSTVYWYL